MSFSQISLAQTSGSELNFTNANSTPTSENDENIVLTGANVVLTNFPGANSVLA